MGHADRIRQLRMRIMRDEALVVVSADLSTRERLRLRMESNSDELTRLLLDDDLDAANAP